jgi:hypothetical protein
LLRIPPEEDIPEQIEDEILCLNLDVTMPAVSDPMTSKPSLPVLIWIHGKLNMALKHEWLFSTDKYRLQGVRRLCRLARVQLEFVVSIILNFTYSYHYLDLMNILAGSDPTNLIARSIQMSKPMIVVTMNYRLNAFAFGDCRSEINLALKDQRMAIDFVSSHIAGFGGDPVS